MIFCAFQILQMVIGIHAPSVAWISHACLVLGVITDGDNVLGCQLFY